MRVAQKHKLHGHRDTWRNNNAVGKQLQRFLQPMLKVGPYEVLRPLVVAFRQALER